MSNPSNLLRPSLLGNNGQANAQAQSNPSPNLPEKMTISMAELTPLVAAIASQILQQQGPSIVQAALNPNASLSTISDQEIETQHRNNISDLDKIPDVVKCLRDFSGNSGEFNSWKKSVERILKIYEPTKGTAKYYGILSVTRNKIVGNADIALESYNTPLDWAAIAKCLTLHYADKRDLSTLEYQMTSLIQGKKSVQEFYQLVYKHLSLILNKIGCLDTSVESLHLLTQTYRDKALDTFVRGLNGDLPKLLGMREPVDLPQALHLCLKLENQTYRANYAHNNSFNQNIRKLNVSPPLPPQNYSQQRPVNNPSRRINNYQRTFYAELAYLPQNSNINNNARQSYRNNQSLLPNQFQQNQVQFHNQQRSNFQTLLPNQQHPFQPQSSPRPRPQPEAEPMEVDESMRSRRLNYMNRPNDRFINNRPPPSINQPQPKVQRTFYVDANSSEYDHALENANDQTDQTLEDYMTSIEQSDNPEGENENFSDIHFLEW